jgi:hypothetical protein
VYRLDDGTGVMDCWKYYDFGTFSTSRSLALGDFVTVKGQLNVSQEYSFFSLVVLIFFRELILIVSSIELSASINMESLHIATVLRRDQEAQMEQDSRARVTRRSDQPQTTCLASSFSIESTTIDQLTTLFSADSWFQTVSSCCTCQYFNKQIVSETNALCQSLFCSCFAKYSPLDPDGLIRLRLLSYLLRIQSALNTTQTNHFTLQELM